MGFLCILAVTISTGLYIENYIFIQNNPHADSKVIGSVQRYVRKSNNRLVYCPKVEIPQPNKDPLSVVLGSCPYTPYPIGSTLRIAYKDRSARDIDATTKSKKMFAIVGSGFGLTVFGIPASICLYLGIRRNQNYKKLHQDGIRVKAILKEIIIDTNYQVSKRPRSVFVFETTHPVHGNKVQINSANYYLDISNLKEKIPEIIFDPLENKVILQQGKQYNADVYFSRIDSTLSVVDSDTMLQDLGIKA